MERVERMEQWARLPAGTWKPEGEILARHELNLRYMRSLEIDRLLTHHKMLAGLVRAMDADPLDYGGWESANCQLKGHFVGHYLSACAMDYAYFGDEDMRGAGERIVSILRRCQLENGDGWCFSTPEVYLNWLERGKAVWAPQYTIHKTLMGLEDMATLAHSQEAVVVLKDAAKWFLNWTAGKTREEMDDILDVETGGMLEAWVELYAITKEKRYLPLIEAYRRPRIFDALLRGEDVLTMMHANTTIPEALGYARAYEVLGDPRDLEAVRSYWRLAVEERGGFVTGGQTYNEAWTPPFRQSEYLGTDNQEHCVVYNMIRLADFLFRHSGEAKYLEYIARNYVNGILAQQHGDTGMVAYYLPMNPGARVKWGSETRHFWCCHGTLVQAHNGEGAYMAYRQQGRLLVAQYQPGTIRRGERGSATLRPRCISTHYAPERENAGRLFRPFSGQSYELEFQLSEPEEFTLTLRIPEWLSEEATVEADGEELWRGKEAGLIDLKRLWSRQKLLIRFPCKARVSFMDDRPEYGAFLMGDDVLVGLTEEPALSISSRRAAENVRPCRPGTMECEPPRYVLDCGDRTIFLMRLRDLKDETYTMYFRFNEKN